MNVKELKSMLNNDPELNKILNNMNEGKDKEWIEKAYFTLSKLGPGWGEFTTCDLWIGLHRLKIDDPEEPRSMAVVITKAKSNGLIKSTNKWTRSPRPINHSRPVRVWEWVQ